MHTQLCQKELAALRRAQRGRSRWSRARRKHGVFGEAADEAGKPQRLHFVNIREAAGWSAEARAATPKIAALLAAAALPEPEPVPRVTFARKDGC